MNTTFAGEERTMDRQAGLYAGEKQKDEDDLLTIWKQYHGERTYCGSDLQAAS